MIYLILDTNIWIYLANGYDITKDKGFEPINSVAHFLLFETLIEKSYNEEIILLTNEIIESEWNRHRNGAAKKIVSDVEKQIFKNRENEINLTHEDKDFEKELKEIIRKNEEHIKEIEKIIKTKCKKIKISDTVRSFVTELREKGAISIFRDKQKNNYNDAIILFSAIEYLKQNLNSFDQAIFISNNYKEFGKNKKEEEFHPDLVKFFGSVNIIYQRNLPKSLGLSEDIQTELEMYFDYLRETGKSFFCMREDCNSIGIFDSKIRYSDGSSESEDTRQLKIFDLSKIKFSQTVKFVKSGRCQKCNSLHIECPECHNLMLDFEEDNVLFCNNCEIGYERKISTKNNDEIIIPLTKHESFNKFNHHE